MIEVDTIDTVVIGDVHGSASKLQAIIHKYGIDGDVRYVLLGDIIDGGEGGVTDVMQTMDLVEGMVNDLGAVALKANHEWVLDAAMNEADPEHRDYWLNGAWRVRPRYDSMWGYEKNMLTAYGIDPRLPNDEAIKGLREEMDSLGHVDIIRTMPLYYEAPGFIVVHAGLTEAPWLEQKEELDKAEAEVTAEAPSFASEPVQIFDDRVYVGNSRRRQPKYASQSHIPTDIDGRTLVTGHAHMSLSPEERITGERVRLAGMHSDPLFVWESWNNEVVAVE